MRVGALGGVQAVGLDGRDIALGGRLESRVLAALVARGDKVASLDLLADAAFGGVGVNGAAVRIQNHVSRLRRRLGSDVILTVHGGYRLDTPRVAIDWQGFERLVALGRSEADASQAAALITEALSWWRGDPFTDLEDWPTIRPLVARLIETHRTAEEALAGIMLASGRGSEAVALLETLVAEEPLRERRWALYLCALWLESRPAAALRAFQDARTVLAEIGLEPSSELRDVERVIASNDDRLAEQYLGRTVGSIVACGAGGHGRVAVGKPGAAVDANRGIPPRPLTRWFGDVGRVEQLARELATSRLMTLTGPGGVGKTRVALELCRLVATGFTGGVWFFDLAAVSGPSTLAAAMSSTLAIAPQPGMSPLEALLDWLRGRRALLVLDNCEHLTDAVADLVAAINLAHDSVTVLATTREVLGLSWERVVPTEGLNRVDAVALFLDRAWAADATVTFTEPRLAVVAAICDRLDGMPLAIELAAARIRSATLEDLLTRLDDGLGLVRSTGYGVAPRHRSVRASVEWSYRLLGDVERTVFDRLAVFARAFDARAAVAVVTDDAIVEGDVLDILDDLVDKSMIITDRRPRSAQFRLLDTLRQFGLERLQERGDVVSTRRRHLECYVARAERTHGLWASARQVEADHLFELDWADLRAAHEWAIATGDLGAAQRLVAGVDAHAHCQMRTEVGAWALRTLELSSPTRPASTDLYGRVAHWTLYAGDHHSVIEIAERGVAAAPTPEDPSTTLCRAFQLVAMLASGRVETVGAAAPSLDRAAAGATDPFGRAWGWAALCLAAPAVSPARYDVWVQALERDAAQFESPFVRLGATYYRTMKHLFVDEPPNTEAAEQLASRGLVGAVDVHDRQLVGQFMLLSLFVTLTRGGTPRPGDVVATLSELYDTRNWLMASVGLECASTTLTLVGRFGPSAVIEGFLDAKGLQWGGNPRWSAMRASALAIAADAQSTHTAVQLTARGATMTRDEVMAFALEQLNEEAW